MICVRVCYLGLLAVYDVVKETSQLSRLK